MTNRNDRGEATEGPAAPLGRSGRRRATSPDPRGGRAAAVLFLFTVGLLLAAPAVTDVAGAQMAGDGDEEAAEETVARGGGGPMVRAHRIDPARDIRIDGRLDEASWQRATAITDFTQQDPVEGAEPSEPTEVHVLYDEDNLYIGAVLHDSEPGGVIGHQRQRDAGLGTDDRFMWILDTFRDGRTGYFFETNPAGLMGDGLITGGGFFGINKSWDGIWEVRTRTGDVGWSVEIRIPFSTLNFDPEVDAWGINFQRTIRRRNEEIVWSGWRRNQRLTRPVHAGRLVGLEGISQGVGVEVEPYTSGNWTRSPALDEPRDLSGKIGGDVQYSITPSLRAAATVNTDFAEVEVDRRRVNLSRFPLFFPERRDFFLEGSGVFSFAPRQGVNPFFTRRIGLVEGEETPIHFGTRLAGQQGPYELGFFQVRTGQGETVTLEGEARSVPSEDFTAARVKRSLFSQSHVGAIYTRRATHGGPEETVAPPDRHTAGMDFDLFTSEFLGEYNLQFEGFFAWHTDPVPGGGSGFADRRARGVRFNFPNDVWRFHASLRDFGEAFDPAVGFQRRNGFRRLQPTLTYAPRPESVAWARQLQWQVAYEYLTSLDGLLLTRETDLTLFQLEFESGDNISFGSTRLLERLRNPFRIREGVVLDPGRYETTDWSASFRTAGRRKLSGRVEVSRGGFWSGDRTRFDGRITARPLPGVSFSTQVQRNKVRLPEGEFDTNVLRFGADWDPSPLQSLTASLQYDDVSEVVGLFTRFRWIVRPGNDVFLVYSHNWRNEAERIFDRHLSTVSQGAAVKMSYTYRF